MYELFSITTNYSVTPVRPLTCTVFIENVCFPTVSAFHTLSIFRSSHIAIHRGALQIIHFREAFSCPHALHIVHDNEVKV